MIWGLICYLEELPLFCYNFNNKMKLFKNLLANNIKKLYIYFNNNWYMLYIIIIIIILLIICNVNIIFCDNEDNKLKELETLLVVYTNEYNKAIDSYEFYFDLLKQVKNQPVIHEDIVKDMRERAWEQESLADSCHIKINNTILSIREINPSFEWPIIRQSSDLAIHHLTYRR